MNLDEELKNLKENPEKELDKMKSSSEPKENTSSKPKENTSSNEQCQGPPNDAPNVGSAPPNDAPNMDAPNMDAPNMDAPNMSPPNSKDGKGSAKNPNSRSSDNEEVYKVLDLILSTIIEKLKLVFMMPYVFFKHYVKDFLSENETGEFSSRDIRPAVISFVLVVAGEFGLSFLTKDFSMVKLIPVAGCLVLCMRDSDKTKK